MSVGARRFWLFFVGVACLMFGLLPLALVFFFLAAIQRFEPIRPDKH